MASKGDLRTLGLSYSEDPGRESDAQKYAESTESEEIEVGDPSQLDVPSPTQKRPRSSGPEGPYADWVDTREAQGDSDDAEAVEEVSEELDENRSRIDRVRQKLQQHRQQGTEDSGEAARLQSELDRERQERARLEGELNERIHAMEERLRGGSGDNEMPDPQDVVDFANPAVKAALQQAFDEGDMATYNQIYSRLMMENTERIVDERLEELESDRRQDRQERELSQQQQKLVDNVEHGIERAIQLGGLEAEVAQDFLQNGDSSLLWAMLQRHQTLADTPSGVLEAIMLTARAVERADVQEGGGDESAQSEESAADAPTRRTADTASSRTGANRSVRREVQRRKARKGDDDTPVEEKLKRSILSAGDPTHRLPSVWRTGR